MTKDRFDIHQHITDKIVSAIERGAGEFRLPWHRGTGNIMRPVNIASKKAYRGVNVVALWAYHAQYLSSWLSVMKEDRKAIFTAASKGWGVSYRAVKLMPPGPGPPLGAAFSLAQLLGSSFPIGCDLWTSLMLGILRSSLQSYARLCYVERRLFQIETYYNITINIHRLF